ncbi:hypothetical protein WQG_15560 [Bibersteinia trehalosi USDA-ARS-USMARC-192]|nr:hypothetical protein [Bibersteinia trehalosi]AGH38833.1 hypothetical protein WQG_15560 [Bibersteinia trehalosi USDA-ARS-USMARC-192]
MLQYRGRCSLNGIHQVSRALQFEWDSSSIGGRVILNKIATVD